MPMRQPLFIFLFFLLSLIALLNFTALEFYLYWRYPWLDSVTHFLAGLSVALGVLWFFFDSGYVPAPRRSPAAVLTLSLASIVAVGMSWEVFEVAIGATVVGEAGHLLDTLLDLLMDGAGALAGAAYFIRTRRKKELYAS